MYVLFLLYLEAIIHMRRQVRAMLQNFLLLLLRMKI